VLTEHLPALFAQCPQAPFMSFTVPTTHSAPILAATHIDARQQTVPAEGSPFPRLIEHFHTGTGIPAVLNTSLNSGGEPIVESPEQALAFLFSTSTDALVINHAVILKEDQLDTVDTIVIGGGIAGLLTALRLARSGQHVALVEADRLGSGATCANHGMLHSGALYARRHGHIVRHCQQAHPAFSALLGTAELPTEDAVYILPPTEAVEFLFHLDTHGITHHQLTPDDVPELRRSVTTTHVLITVRERVFSSRRIIATLAAQCLAAGVTILTGNAIDRITHSAGRVTGVILGAVEHVPAASVVIAAGTGTPELLTRIASRHRQLLKSRLDMMVHLPAARFRRGLIFAALDPPIVMPAPGGGALSSFFGGVQPEIAGRRDFPVDVIKAPLLLREMDQVLTPGTIDPGRASAYVAGKTDYVGTIHAENGVVNPGCHVIDHTQGDNLRGLYTVITGKMTLGFHASKDVTDTILGTDTPLLIEPQEPTAIPTGLLAVEPWAPPTRI